MRLPVTRSRVRLTDFVDMAASRDDRYERAVQRLAEYTFRLEDDGGYAGMAVRPADHAVDLYWKGEVSEAMAALIAEVRNDCDVSVLPAAYDAAELREARTRLTSSPGFRGCGIHTIALLPDGSGLEVGYAGERPPTAVVRELGVAVRWQSGPGPVPC